MKLKKLFPILIVTALLVGFTACSNDDDDDDVRIPINLVGKWTPSYLNYKTSSTGTAISDAAKIILEQVYNDLHVSHFVITFNEDGTCELQTSATDIRQGTYTHLNGKLKLKGDSLLVPFGGKDSLSISTNLISNTELQVDIIPILLNDFEELQQIQDQLENLSMAISLFLSKLPE